MRCRTRRRGSGWPRRASGRNPRRLYNQDNANLSAILLSSPGNKNDFRRLLISGTKYWISKPIIWTKALQAVIFIISLVTNKFTTRNFLKLWISLQSTSNNRKNFVILWYFLNCEIRGSVYPNTDTMWMVALSTLRADDQSALQVVTKRAAHHADVLLQHEVVLKENIC